MLRFKVDATFLKQSFKQVIKRDLMRMPEIDQESRWPNLLLVALVIPPGSHLTLIPQNMNHKWRHRLNSRALDLVC